MPEQTVAPSESWTPESVEQQAVELEKKEAEQVEPEKEEAEVETKDKVEKVVPIGAVTELRAQKREAVQRAQAAEAQNQQLQRQMLEFMARQQPAQQQVDPNDPLAVLQDTTQRTAAELRYMREEQARQQQGNQQQAAYQQFVAHVQAQEAEFIKVQPDASEGIAFLKQNRVNEYKAAGLTHNEAMQRMLKDEHDLVVWASQAGENPAKAAFDMAVQRGYVSPKQKLEMQRNGQGASLPTGQGGKGGGEPSLEALLKMSGPDFAKATAGDKWEKLLKKHS